ncbi:uncharacterized protein LOC124401975 [Silurus meridionalis]|uniref:uncharacterized protein LOC124401975 n=1 Tax=Silurus meridionalis TaxID=175797 RepID=UPI001EEB9853|nr:uncharacterized protein LOC124401975 [Silurus meridionalis]
MGCRLSGPWMSDGTMGVSAQDLRYIQNHEALRILTGYEQPITVQIEGRRGRSLQYSRPSDSSTQTERPRDNAASDRQCYSHITLPGRNHGDGGRYEYLPNTPRDLEDIRTSSRHDPEFSPKDAEKYNCLLSCCSSNMDEPSSFQSQTEDEDYMMEKTVGYLPLHHELDSGLGWTDGSFHQGELSGLETEEGLDECHTHQGGRAARVRGGSPSSESFISSELSDSGFYSVSTAEFLHFQRLLEKRMRMYNSRLHHQGELQNLCMDTQKAHRELEAIPEALTMQPDSECVETEAYPHQMVRVASMQLRKNERPNLNRHSSSSAAIFSTCSSPSGQQSLTPCATTAAGMLRRSRTLHHRPVPVEQRRRASHPTSPNYCSMTLNRYRHALQQQIPAETKTDAKYYTCHANQPVHHANHLPHHVSHATNHANHITHHVNHPTHHASYSNHQANHPTNNRHLANYTTLHANHPTHMANQAAPNANDFTHPTRHANLSPHPYHATLPAQHTHHTHSAFSSHSPHHDHAHTTLLTQHTNHDHLTLPAQHTHHNHAHPTLPAQHTHHDHTTLLAQHTHHDHTHTTSLPNTHTTTTPTRLSLPNTHNDHGHPTLPGKHTHNDHAHPTLPAQHTHNDNAHPTLPAQHTHHDHAHRLSQLSTHNDNAHRPSLPNTHTTTTPTRPSCPTHTPRPHNLPPNTHTTTTQPPCPTHTHTPRPRPPTLPAQHTHNDHAH